MSISVGKQLKACGKTGMAVVKKERK